MNKYFKSGLTFSLALLSIALVACGCNKDTMYASITRTPDNTGGSALSFSYDEDSRTAWFGGDGETVEYYSEDVAIGRVAGNRVGITITAPDDIKDFDGFKLTIYDDKIYEGLDENEKPKAFDGDNYMYIYPLVSETQKSVSIKIKWNKNTSEQEYMVKIKDGTNFAKA